MVRNILHKKYCDLPSELYEITSHLIIKPDAATGKGLRPYVQWSKNDIQPLEDAIEQLVQRVRDDTKAGEKNIYPRRASQSKRDLRGNKETGTRSRHGRAVGAS